MSNDATTQCLIVDDEPLARDVIRRYIEQMPMLKLAGECANAMQVMSFLQQQHVDLIFLDINMPQLKGNELLKVIKPSSKVIYTTAFPEYALEGYELDIVDFLLKPIQFERFFKAVHKALQSNGQHTSTQLPLQPKIEPFVYFRADRKMVKVLLQDILYIESMKDYIKVFTTSGVIITKQSITSVEAMLPQHQFARTHRSFIVSLAKISSFTHEVITVSKSEIPIGKLYRNNILKVLG